MNNLSRDERNKLVIDHIPRAYVLCRWFKSRYPDLELCELRSIAHEGLIMASRWHHSNGKASYWVYAEVCITRKIKAHIGEVFRYVPIAWL